VTRLVIVDAVLLVLGAVYTVWLSRINCGSQMKLFRWRTPSGRERRVGRAVNLVSVGGLVLGTESYGFGTRMVNLLVFIAALLAVDAGGAVLHNRAVDRR